MLPASISRITRFTRSRSPENRSRRHRGTLFATRHQRRCQADIAANQAIPFTTGHHQCRRGDVMPYFATGIGRLSEHRRYFSPGNTEYGPHAVFRKIIADVVRFQPAGILQRPDLRQHARIRPSSGMENDKKYSAPRRFLYRGQMPAVIFGSDSASTHHYVSPRWLMHEIPAIQHSPAQHTVLWSRWDSLKAALSCGSTDNGMGDSMQVNRYALRQRHHLPHTVIPLIKILREKPVKRRGI